MKATFTSAVARGELEYRCDACGYAATAIVTAMGEGGQSSLNRPGTAGERARQNAVANLERNLAIASCPKCGHHDQVAVTFWWIRRLLPVVLVTATIVLMGWAPAFVDMNMKESDVSTAGWITTFIALLIAIPMVITHVMMGWSRAIRSVRFEGGGAQESGTTGLRNPES